MAVEEGKRQQMLVSIEEEIHQVVNTLQGGPHAEMGHMIAFHFGWGEDEEEGIQGKRIRPLLTLLTCQAAGGHWQVAIPAAASVELIHNFSLIHDDIEDASQTRRGRPTLWTKWNLAQALNTGDALLILSQSASHRLLTTGVPADNVLRVLRSLDQACLQLTIGQHLDLAFENRARVSVDEYLEMIGGKTSSLIACACEIGAMLAEARSDRQEAFAKFGWHLGLAFQVQDDILGIWGEPSITGKAAGDDLLAHKKTLPILHGLEHSAEFRRLWQTDGLSEALVAELRLSLEQAGALDYAREIAAKHTREALANLEHAQPVGQAAEELQGLARALLSRHS